MLDVGTRKPLVVPDLNYLQKRPVGAEHLSNKRLWVWPLRIFSEASDRGSRSIGDIGKLLRVFNLNRSHSTVAMQVPEMCRREQAKDFKLDVNDLIDEQLGSKIGVIAACNDPLRFTSHLKEINDYLAHAHNLFWDLMIYTRRSDTILSPDDHQGFLQSDDFARDYLTYERAHSYFSRVFSGLDTANTGPGPDLQLMMPDKSAMLATLKCMLFIRLRWEAKPLTAKELNDYDDVTYAVTGALAGCIATNDKGLARMVRVCFPRTKIISDIKDLRRG